MLQPPLREYGATVTEITDTSSKPEGPGLESVTIDGPYHPAGPGQTPSRQRIFTCRPATAADEDALRQADSGDAGAPGLPPSGDRRGARRRCSTFYNEGRGRERVRGRHRVGASSASWSIPSSCSGSRPIRRIVARGVELSVSRPRARVAAVVLPLEQHSRRRAARRRGARPPEGCRRCSSSRCGGCWPTRGRRRWSTTSSRSGCSCAPFDGQAPDPNVFPEFDENLREAFMRETELFLESQLREDRERARAAERRLHVPQRAAGAALPDSRRRRAAGSGA